MAGVTEDQLLQDVRQMAIEHHLLIFHCRDSRVTFGKGFPDLVISGPRGTVFAELKTNGSSLTPDQRHWGSILQRGGEQWYIWRPRDLESGVIAATLKSISTHVQQVLS